MPAAFSVAIFAAFSTAAFSTAFAASVSAARTAASAAAFSAALAASSAASLSAALASRYAIFSLGFIAFNSSAVLAGDTATGGFAVPVVGATGPPGTGPPGTGPPGIGGAFLAPGNSLLPRLTRAFGPSIVAAAAATAAAAPTAIIPLGPIAPLSFNRTLLSTPASSANFLFNSSVSSEVALKAPTILSTCEISSFDNVSDAR